MTDARPDEIIAIGIGAIELRRARVEHADAVAAAVLANLDHLTPWMPWANEQSCDPAFQRERLAGTERAWDNGDEFQYVLVDGDAVIGSPGLMTRRGPDTLELGYWLAAAQSGRGIMTAATRQLVEWAQTQVTTAVIVCDAANERSNALARRLGFTVERTESHPPQTPSETGIDNVWTSSRVRGR